MLNSDIAINRNRIAFLEEKTRRLAFDLSILSNILESKFDSNEWIDLQKTTAQEYIRNNREQLLRADIDYLKDKYCNGRKTLNDL